MPRRGGSLIAHRWQRIADLPDDWRSICCGDLHAVHAEWAAARTALDDPDTVWQLQERLMTVWAIETGIIERLYEVDRGVTAALAEAGLDAMERFHADGQLTGEARSLIEDQRSALDMVMDLVGGQRELTSSYIRELHRGLTEHQDTRDAIDAQGRRFAAPLLKGEWKRLPNNPIEPDGRMHEYCPPEFVQDEIDQLLAWHASHETQGVCPEVEAAWLHHRFSQIHPFEDGNGRVARALTAAVFLKSDYLVLVIRDEEHRDPYLDALEAADGGDLKPLVDLFADIQAADLADALALVTQQGP